MPSRIVPALKDFVRELDKLPHTGEEYASIELEAVSFNAVCDEIESSVDRPGMRQVTNGVAYQPRQFFKVMNVTFFNGPIVPYPPVEVPEAVAAKPARLKAIAKPKRDVLAVATPPADEEALPGSRRALRRRRVG